jgi:hypothetical protein
MLRSSKYKIYMTLPNAIGCFCHPHGIWTSEPGTHNLFFQMLEVGVGGGGTLTHMNSFCPTPKQRSSNRREHYIGGAYQARRMSPTQTWQLQTWKIEHANRYLRIMTKWSVLPLLSRCISDGNGPNVGNGVFFQKHTSDFWKKIKFGISIVHTQMYVVIKIELQNRSRSIHMKMRNFECICTKWQKKPSSANTPHICCFL